MSIVGVNLSMGLPFPMGLVLLKSLTVRAVFAPIPGTWPDLVPLVQAGRLAVADTFTHRMGLSEVLEAYELFDSRADGVLKILLTRTPERPSGSSGVRLTMMRPLRVAELGAGDEPRRRRRRDEPGQRVDDRLVVDPPALEVPPRLVQVALRGEVHLLEAAEAVVELRLGEADARRRERVGRRRGCAARRPWTAGS